MADRRDAVVAFSRVMTALEEHIGGMDPEVKFTVGRVEVQPNAPSVVAEKVRFRIDLRHPDNAVIEECDGLIRSLAASAAAPCEIALTPLVSAASNQLRCRNSREDRRHCRPPRHTRHADLVFCWSRCAANGATLPDCNDLHPVPQRRQSCRGRMGRSSPCFGWRAGSLRPDIGLFGSQPGPDAWVGLG